MPYIVLAIMLLIIVLLAAYAACLLRQVYCQNKIKNHQKHEQKNLQLQRQQENAHSILIIAKCMLQEQVSYTEASIRISVLSRSLNVTDIENTHYEPFNHLAQATEHIPILNAWKNLSKKQKIDLNKERESIEVVHKAAVIEAAKKLLVLQ